MPFPAVFLWSFRRERSATLLADRERPFDLRLEAALRVAGNRADGEVALDDPELLALDELTFAEWLKAEKFAELLPFLSEQILLSISNQLLRFDVCYLSE